MLHKITEKLELPGGQRDGFSFPRPVLVPRRSMRRAPNWWMAMEAAGLLGARLSSALPRLDVKAMSSIISKGLVT